MYNVLNERQTEPSSILKAVSKGENLALGFKFLVILSEVEMNEYLY